MQLPDQLLNLTVLYVTLGRTAILLEWRLGNRVRMDMTVAERAS